MGEVIRFGGITKLDLPVDQVLEAAAGKLEHVVLIGYTKDGEEEYFASTFSDGAEVLWLLERAKLQLLEIAGEDSQ